MLGKLGIGRHAMVAVSVAGCGALAALGFIGTGPDTERFEAKQIVIEPAGPDGVQITEVVDMDFGSQRRIGGDQRHGYERVISNDFGVPINISAASPDAPDDVSSGPFEGDTRIRIGDPDVTVRGQHRYVLRYTLPNARISTGALALDVIGTDEDLITERFEVALTGIKLDAPLCNVGATATSGGCQLERDGDVYRVVFEPLKPGQGITIGGTIVGLAEPVDVVANAIPVRRDDAPGPLTVGVMALGLAGAAGTFAVAQRRGRNEVFGGGGAADAAFGALPKPGSNEAMPATSLVSDRRMAELATIEFVPPRGLKPWQGNVVLTERISNESVMAWFSGMAADDAIVITEVDDKLEIRPGPKLANLDAESREILVQLFGGRSEITLGKYDKKFAAAWASVLKAQESMIADSRWWKRLPPGTSGGSSGALIVILVILGFIAYIAGAATLAVLGLFRLVPMAMLVGVTLPAITASVAYKALLPVRSGTGSAVALQVESFRRFLQASEGRHVEWAWTQGVLREYSAWAVSLGAADAWGKALASSNIAAPELIMNSPMLVYSMRSSMTSAHTAPSSSGSGGGGGFSGGSVGGGGGGGSSGSW